MPPTELIEKRQENSKTFDLGNGKRQLIASLGAIHYKNNYADKSEQWKAIDLTWEGNRITKAPYELTLEGKKLTLKNKKTGETSTIELLESKPAGLKWEVVPKFDRVCFRHIVPSDKIPFEAKFKVTGKIPFRTRAQDDEGELPLETTLEDGILIEKLSSLPRSAKGNIRVDPTWQVGESGNDLYRRSQGVQITSITAQYGEAGAGTGSDYWGMGTGQRFTNITIPNGSTIDSAYLKETCWSGKTGATPKTRISAEDVDDAAIFVAVAATFDARWAARTSARIDWDNIPIWTIDVEYPSPDIKTVIKEIVDRPGWNSGQAMAIFWEDFETRSSQVSQNYRNTNSWDDTPAKAARLEINYTEPAPPYDPENKSANMGAQLVAAGLI